MKLLKVKRAPNVSEPRAVNGGCPAQVVEVSLETRGCGMQPSFTRVRRRNKLKRVTSVTRRHVIGLSPGLGLVEMRGRHDVHVSSLCSTDGRVIEVHVILLDAGHAEVGISI